LKHAAILAVAALALAGAAILSARGASRATPGARAEPPGPAAPQPVLPPAPEPVATRRADDADDLWAVATGPSDVETRSAAVDALPYDRERFARLLADPSPDIRIIAVARTKDARMLADAFRVEGSRDVRFAIVDALAELGDRVTLASLRGGDREVDASIDRALRNP